MIRWVTVPPSTTRTTWDPTASENQIAPSASSAQPSGAMPGTEAHTRRFDSVASSAMSNAT